MRLISNTSHPAEASAEIAKGSERRVYLVQDSPDMLLKVMRSKHLRTIAQSDDKTFRGWLQIRKAYALYRREQKTWNDAMLRAAKRGTLPPLAAIGSLVLTKSGLGQLVERILDAEGNTAPTLQNLLQQPLSPERLEALNVFVAALYDWHIPAYDLGPENIVWDAASRRFVLVDGFGDRSVVPIKTWFRKANDRRLDRAFAETAQKCPLIWDGKARRFTQVAKTAAQ